MNSNFVQPIGNLTPNTAAMQLKYDYDQLDMPTGNTVRGAAIEIKAHAERAKVSMIAIGQKLAEVKALLPHGQFEDWCQVEFDMSQRTAQRMMAAAEVFGDKSDTVSLLSDSAMYMLSAPSVPEAARIEVIEQAQETGTSPTKAEVQAVLDKHKPDEELAQKCYKLQTWLMGKGWAMFHWNGEQGITKGDHKFAWDRNSLADAWEKVKAAEKIERAALAAFIKLTPPKNDTVSPLSEAQPVTFKADPADPNSMDVHIKTFTTVLPPKPEPPPGRPLPGWVAGEPDEPLMDEDEDNEAYTSAMVNLAERENKNSSSMATAIILELPPIPFPDKDLLINQVKRAVGILNEEGFATAADLLRVAGRCAYDAQETASLPVDVEPVVTEKVRTANGEGEVSREFLINLTISSFKVALDSLDDYGRLTGHFTDIPPAQRILEKIIKNLQDNLT